MKCDICNDTGYVELETINFIGQYFSKEKNGLVYKVIGSGIYEIVPCVYVSHYED